MSISPYIGQRARVHYNLNAARSGAPAWSIVIKGRVVARARFVRLVGATAHVGQAAALRIANGANRSVHAWITGVLFGFTPVPDNAAAVGYNPRDRKEQSFTFRADGRPFTFADEAWFTADGAMFVR